MALLAKVLGEAREQSPLERADASGRGYCVALRLFFDGWDQARDTGRAVVVSDTQ